MEKETIQKNGVTNQHLLGRAAALRCATPYSAMQGLQALDGAGSPGTQESHHTWERMWGEHPKCSIYKTGQAEVPEARTLPTYDTLARKKSEEKKQGTMYSQEASGSLRYAGRPMRPLAPPSEGSAGCIRLPLFNPDPTRAAECPAHQRGQQQQQGQGQQGPGRGAPGRNAA